MQPARRSIIACRDEGETRAAAPKWPLARFFAAAWYPAFKLAVFLLLIANTVVYVLEGTPSEAIDAVAWLALLLLFELETAHSERLSTGAALLAVHCARFAAGVAVLVAAIGYIEERAWIEAVNAWLWIAVVVVLEVQVRFRARLDSARGTVERAAATLYLGLSAMVLLWAWRGEWLDAYDAALWLLAFATIEMNVLLRKGD